MIKLVVYSRRYETPSIDNPLYGFRHFSEKSWPSPPAPSYLWFLVKLYSESQNL